MTFEMYADRRERLVWNDRDPHRQESRRGWRREREMEADGGRVLAGGHCRNHLAGQRLSLGLGRRRAVDDVGCSGAGSPQPASAANTTPKAQEGDSYSWNWDDIRGPPPHILTGEL